LSLPSNYNAPSLSTLHVETGALVNVPAGRVLFPALHTRTFRPPCVPMIKPETNAAHLTVVAPKAGGSPVLRGSRPLDSDRSHGKTRRSPTV